jgi:hypothetical protein
VRAAIGRPAIRGVEGAGAAALWRCGSGTRRISLRPASSIRSTSRVGDSTELSGAEIVVASTSVNSCFKATAVECPAVEAALSCQDSMCET